MEKTLLIICICLSALSCALCVLLLLKKSAPQQENKLIEDSLRRLDEKTENIARLSDYSARAVENLNQITETRLTNMQNRLNEDIKYIVDANAQNLERIRRSVDEKLTSSIDGRLSESFARVSERLEKMVESVGEMKALSNNVQDIRRVFSNVKLRGTWGEAQLDALLSQMLSPEQFERSVKLNPLDNAIVDFAIFLPAKDGTVPLPVDSKFPVEEFERLCEASERCDRESEERARKNLEKAVKLQCDAIAKKYIMPPLTTDFAVMFLPSEALYAEVARMSGLADYMRSRRIIACGPTNFGAFLSVLQTGFRTAAIEKRSGELRETLDGFRHDFAVFCELLEKTRKKLQEAQDAVESAEKRTTTIGKKLDSFKQIGTSDGN